jgi:hypothetical protein
MLGGFRPAMPPLTSSSSHNPEGGGDIASILVNAARVVSSGAFSKKVRMTYLRGQIASLEPLIKSLEEQ